MKTQRVELRLSDVERQKMADHAAAIGLNLSAFLRLAALEKIRRDGREVKKGKE